MKRIYIGKGDPKMWFHRWFHLRLFGRSLTIGWVGKQMPGASVPATDVLYNPHPSRDPRYDVRIVRDNEDGTVDVRYVSGGPAWTVNDDVPEIWGRVER